jgi:small subunit ribosomal protein S21
MIVRLLIKRNYHLADARAQEGESFEQLLKRFNKKVQEEGIISKARRRMYFTAPSVLRKKKQAAKRRKSIKATRKNM